MNGKDTELLQLAADYRDSLRQSVYFVRQLDVEAELSAAQLSLLNMVADDGLRVSAIAANLGMKVPSATEAIKRLETFGYLERSTDPEDSRAVVIRLSESGREIVTQSNTRRNELMAELLARLSPAQQECLRAAIPVIAQLNSTFTQGN
ncbi:MarR family winged helix-turn-helix transcriptional regulator [Psychromicrobium sp. YIM B11713]|uniref:MarR family winged helix-turn-helix transcriptional regulator n=1 Tax=Psychromicrobium sp. YIM B11713 TaxID=3145233 RepID=UPI00374F8BEB